MRAAGGLVAIDDVLPEVRQRLTDWRAILTEESTQARQMLRTLLDGRLVFTPRPEIDGVEFTGQGDYGRLFAGLIGSQALASPTGTDDGWRLPVKGYSDVSAA